jgi:predicted transcriptional regulator of viral defense system
MRDTARTTRIPKTEQAPDRSRLFEVASKQGGYFTSEQASMCGYSRALLYHHAKSGTFIRVRKGLYRFREYPSSSRDDVLAAWMAVGKV